MANDEEKQAPEDDKRVESPNADVVVSKTVTALVPHTFTHMTAWQNVSEKDFHRQDLVPWVDFLSLLESVCKY